MSLLSSLVRVLKTSVERMGGVGPLGGEVA